ncbi:hypothetical protein EDB85DRAFT_2153934 [Lactarius pseudohatsudake]|nr:hypothetical protein EDB85DRAFT_2153934 [Lactarius pseudohatsudake]
MSRYQVLQSYVEDYDDGVEESTATMEAESRMYEICRRHQEQHPEEYDNDIYNVEEEEPDYSICNPATRVRVDTDDEPDEADPEYVPAEAVKEYEDDSSADEIRVEEELRLGAEGRAEEVLQEDADQEGYADAQREEQADEDVPALERGSAEELAMPLMFYGECDRASAFVDSWDQWSSQLSFQFTQYQKTTILLSLIRPPVDQWAEDRLRHIEAWRAAGMEDDDEEVLEDTIGRFMEEFVPRADAREEYEEDAIGDPDAEGSVDHGDDTTHREVPSPPSLCHSDQALEEEPDEAEEYIDLCTEDEEDPRDDAREQYGWHAEDFKRDLPAEEHSEDELVDEYYYSDDADAKAEKRVEPPPRKTKKKVKKPVAEKRPITAPRRVLIRAKSPAPTWQKKYISKFGKEALKQAREMGIPDYILEADAEGEIPAEEEYRADETNVQHSAAYDTVQETRPAPQAEASWKGPNTFNAPNWTTFQDTPDAMDLTAGRVKTQVTKAKCHHCFGQGHTRKDCPYREEPKGQRWFSDDSEQPLRQAVPLRTNVQTRAAPRGRSPTIKPRGTAAATYAPTTRAAPTITATPLPSPLPIIGFKSQKPFTAIQHPSPPTEEDVTGMLADLQIRRARAVKTGNFKSAQDIDWRMGMINYLQKTMKPKPSLQDLEGDLEHVEARLSRALVSGNTPEIKSLDLAANKLAEELLKRNVDYRFHTAADLLVQRGRCSRKEGNVTIRPTARPERPLGTAVRRSQADYAEEEAQISRLVAEHAQTPRAKSPVGHYVYGSAQKSQEYWE